MDDMSHRPPAPAGWFEALERSEAEHRAGVAVPAEDVMRALADSVARLEAKRAARRKPSAS